MKNCILVSFIWYGVLMHNCHTDYSTVAETNSNTFWNIIIGNWVNEICFLISKRKHNCLNMFRPFYEVSTAKVITVYFRFWKTGLLRMYNISIRKSRIEYRTTIFLSAYLDCQTSYRGIKLTVNNSFYFVKMRHKIMDSYTWGMKLII